MAPCEQTYLRYLINIQYTGSAWLLEISESGVIIYSEYFNNRYQAVGDLADYALRHITAQVNAQDE